MAIELYPHNEYAYQAARLVLWKTGKAAIIHPTGTGKSFIGFKFCEDFLEKNVCWFSPSEYIFKAQLDNLAADSGAVPENITFLTYARLMLMSSEEIKELRPDLIILDEFHRCGAEQWRTGIQALLDASPSVPLLGLSATNIRFLDNQRDMAKELFDGHIASEITLGEAIARGILKPPKYILSVYSFQEDLERYEGRVEKLRNPTQRNHAEELLKTLRRSLEDADGLDKIFARHMPDRHGKYIVFCSNVTHMNRMISLAPGWFAQLDSAPHLYRAYSPDPATRAAFAAFREDESDHLKLLFTIDMLNEGIHVADVDGVILFRPTVSPVIYKQQIGRALSAGSTKTPVMFDIVNNIENLRSIGALEQEFEEAVLRTSNSEHERQELRQRFQIIDEVRDCRRLFERLNETLTYTWEDMYERAKEYYESHGNLNVPGAYYTADGYALGSWISTQRAVRKGLQRGMLGEERIAMLDAIGMLWTVREKDRWPEYYAAAEAYAREFGHLCVPDAYVTPDGVKLGKWLTTLKVQYKRGGKGRYLTQERIAALDRIGMVWDVDKFQWEQKFQAAQRYYQEFGNLEVPTRYVSPDGTTLGLWIQCARKDYKSGRLDETSVQRLEAIGMVWDIEKMRWERQYQAAAEYYWEHGDLDIPAQFETADGLKLGRWLQRMRRDYKNGVLEKEYMERLEAIGITWNIADRQWEEYYEAARCYYQEHGNLRIAPKYTASDGTRLGLWIQRMRKKYKQKKLTGEEAGRLEAIGMIWDGEADQRERTYQAALDYYREHGDLKIPTNYVDANGLHLGSWVRGVRRAYKKGTLDREQIDRLESIGMIWNTSNQSAKAIQSRPLKARKDFRSSLENHDLQ